MIAHQIKNATACLSVCPVAFFPNHHNVTQALLHSVSSWYNFVKLYWRGVTLLRTPTFQRPSSRHFMHVFLALVRSRFIVIAYAILALFPLLRHRPFLLCCPKSLFHSSYLILFLLFYELMLHNWYSVWYNRINNQSLSHLISCYVTP
jgi:hypothetical protein